MASTAVASIEKVAGWAKVSTVEDGPLDGAVTDQDLRDVCGFMVQWQSLAERLGVGEAALEEVKEDGPDARRKRELMLKKWKAALVFDATYRRLGEAFRGLGRADLCLQVFKLAKAAATSSLEGEGSAIENWDGGTKKDYKMAKSMRGNHQSSHNGDFSHEAYVQYMAKQSNNAKEIWMEADIYDYVIESCEWGEVGLTEDGKLYILFGKSRIDYTAIAEYTFEELKQCEVSTFIALKKTDDVGWEMSAEIITQNSIASAVTVSIKPAYSTVPLVKLLQLLLENGIFKPGSVMTTSSPETKQVDAGSIEIPEGIQEGPQLEAGEDFSKDRKNDYESESPNGCSLKLQQNGETEVCSTLKQANGKWNNLFTATLKVTNTAEKNTAVTDVYGEYLNNDGEWVKCKKTFVGKKVKTRWEAEYDWMESCNFTMKDISTRVMSVRCAIQFEDVKDKAPLSFVDGMRAHKSLPQPLHLRATFVDQEQRTATIRFEQGNPPLDIATRESCEKRYCDGSPLEYYIFADDVESNQRIDATLFFDDEGMLRYIPAADRVSFSSYGLPASWLSGIAYMAKKAGKQECELMDVKRECDGNTVRLYLLSKLECVFPYALKVEIKTPTSQAVGYYQLPPEGIEGASMSVGPLQVSTDGQITVKWMLPRVSKRDYMVIYKSFGTKSIGKNLYNKEAVTAGELKLKAPAVPGDYEVRYYPAWLESHYTGYRHSIYLLAIFNVNTSE